MNEETKTQGNVPEGSPVYVSSKGYKRTPGYIRNLRQKHVLDDGTEIYGTPEYTVYPQKNTDVLKNNLKNFGKSYLRLLAAPFVPGLMPDGYFKDLKFMEDLDNVSPGRITEGIARAIGETKEVSDAAGLATDLIVDPMAVATGGASVAAKVAGKTAGKVAGSVGKNLAVKTPKVIRHADLGPAEVLEKNGGHYVADRLARVEEYNRTHPYKMTIEFESAPTSKNTGISKRPTIRLDAKPVNIEAYDVPSESFFQFKKLQESSLNKLLDNSALPSETLGLGNSSFSGSLSNVFRLSDSLSEGRVTLANIKSPSTNKWDFQSDLSLPMAENAQTALDTGAKNKDIVSAYPYPDPLDFDIWGYNGNFLGDATSNTVQTIPSNYTFPVENGRTVVKPLGQEPVMTNRLYLRHNDTGLERYIETEAVRLYSDLTKYNNQSNLVNVVAKNTHDTQKALYGRDFSDQIPKYLAYDTDPMPRHRGAVIQQGLGETANESINILELTNLGYDRPMTIAHEMGHVSSQKARRAFNKMLEEPSNQNLWDFLQVAPDKYTQEFMDGYAEVLGYTLPDLETKKKFVKALTDADNFVNWFKVIREYQPKSLMNNIEFEGKTWSFPEIFNEFNSDMHARRNFLEMFTDPAKLSTIFPQVKYISAKTGEINPMLIAKDQTYMQPFTGKPMDWFESKTNADILKVLGKDYRNQPFLDKVFFNTTGGYSHLWKQMAQMLPRDVWNRRTLYPLSLAGASGTIGYQLPSTQEMMEKYGK